MGNEEYKKIIDNQSGIYDKQRVNLYFIKTSNLIKELVPKGKTVIEIGSGTGLHIIDLVKTGRYGIGVDYSKKMISISNQNARKAGVDCKFILADVENSIPLKQKFDYAVLIGPWEYFENPARVLQNIKKILNKNGKVIINTHNMLFWPLIAFCEKIGIKKLSHTFWYFNSIKSRLKKYAKNAGFVIEKSLFNYYFLDKVYILKKKIIST